MRKWIPTKQGGRVQFSCPDFDWWLFEQVCIYNEKDPFEALASWASSGCDSAQLRSYVRGEVEWFVHYTTRGHTPPTTPIGFNPDSSRAPGTGKAPHTEAAEAKSITGNN